MISRVCNSSHALDGLQYHESDLEITEHALILPTLMNMFSPEESNLSTEGHVLFAHYQQGMTNYLAIVLYHHSEGVAMAGELDVPPRGTST